MHRNCIFFCFKSKKCNNKHKSAEPSEIIDSPKQLEMNQVLLKGTAVVIHKRGNDEDDDDVQQVPEHEDDDSHNSFGSVDSYPDDADEKLEAEVALENSTKSGPLTITKLYPELDTPIKKQRHKSRPKLSSLFTSSWVRSAILIIFAIYFIINVLLFVKRAKYELPLLDLLPKQSYLNKHLRNHLQLFHASPLISLNFMKPVDFASEKDFNTTMKFIKDIRKLDGVNDDFEMNWWNDSVLNMESMFWLESRQEKIVYSVKQVMESPPTKDDFTTSKKNETSIFIPNSRIYIMMKSFTGSYANARLMDQIRELAEYNYSLTYDRFIVFTSVGMYLEQIAVLPDEFFSLFVLLVESLLAIGLFLLFDLCTLFIVLLVSTSFIVSVLGNMCLFGLTLNMVTLVQLIMLPAFVCEFIYHLPYLFLFDAQGKKNQARQDSLTNDSLDSSTSNENEIVNHTVHNKELEIKKSLLQSLKPSFGTKKKLSEKTSKHDNRKHFVNTRNARLCSAIEKSSSLSTLFLVTSAIFCFIFMCFCTTYNFHVLYIVLMSSCVNMSTHLFFLYPTLLSLFGTCWLNKTKGEPRSVSIKSRL